MRRNPPHAVLFDMDGLLIDSERLAMAALAQAAREIEHEIPDAVAHRLIGLGRDGGSAVLTRWLGEHFPLDGFWSAWSTSYVALVAQGVPAKQGAIEALAALKAANIACAVATSTETGHARYKLERAGLLPHLAVVVGRDAVKHGKPAPDLYLHAAERIGVAAADCWAFEDSLPGLTAAIASGARTHWVPDLAPIAAHELPAGVERIDSLHEICRWLSPTAAYSPG